MTRNERRIHFQTPETSAGTPLCGQKGLRFSVTTNSANVTCKRCLHHVANTLRPCRECGNIYYHAMNCPYWVKRLNAPTIIQDSEREPEPETL